MKITITIDASNAAFEDDPGAEIARILRVASGDFDRGTHGPGFDLRDWNGNVVGYVTCLDTTQATTVQDERSTQSGGKVGE